MIDIKNCSFVYKAEQDHKALKNINLKVKKGEFVVLTGGSGCGKTTILRLLNGLIPYFYEGTMEGNIFIDSKEIRKQSIYEIAKHTGTVFQNPRAQFYTCDTNSELVFGCENQGIEEEEIRKRFDHTVEKFSIEKLMNRSMFALSGGEKQQIACASIDMENTEIILLDEPSANLDHEATQRLKQLIEVWKQEGKTIVAAEHRIAYLWDMADRLVVMNEGRIEHEFFQKDMEHLSIEEMKHLGVRSFIDQNPFQVEIKEAEERDEYIRFVDYRFRYKKGEKKFTYPEIRVAKGEITALIGHNGIGKTTLLHCFAGLKKCKGFLLIDGKKLNRKKRKKSIFMIMQDVSHQLFTESVLDEVLLGMDEEDETVALDILESLDLKQAKDRHPLSLSGGQMQRVAIASGLASSREIILLDEPTSGLDYGHMLEISKLLKELQAKGKTILVATHDSEFIANCCTRKLILGE